MTAGTGILRSINTSAGGVPKRPTTTASVGFDGIAGDRQRDLRFHGGRDRAVSLYSLDLIEQLRADGHPIEPGTLGENLTIAGVDWSLMIPGAQVEVGGVRLWLTKYAHPCKNTSGSFLDGDSTRVSQKVHPGWSRLYARVLQPGTVTAGDTVRVVTAPRSAEAFQTEQR
jgi:MOSC domain-containing protein YiiM